jgi:hypothetical protein
LIAGLYQSYSLPSRIVTKLLCLTYPEAKFQRKPGDQVYETGSFALSVAAPHEVCADWLLIIRHPFCLAYGLDTSQHIRSISMSDISTTRSYRTPIALKLLMGIIPLVFSMLVTDLSVAFRLFIAFGGAANLLEVGERLLALQHAVLAHLLRWLSWGCFFAGGAAAALALYQAIGGW